MAMNLKALNIGLGKGNADAKPASKDKPAKKGASAAASTTFDAGKKAATGFALYLANFGSYANTYGSLAGVIVFLIWLWISNLALLVGATYNVEFAKAAR